MHEFAVKDEIIIFHFDGVPLVLPHVIQPADDLLGFDIGERIEVERGDEPDVPGKSEYEMRKREYRMRKSGV